MKDRSSLSIAGAFVAFLVGSGFATGQEVLQFFVVYGVDGIAGAVLCFALLAYLSVVLLDLGRRYSFSNSRQVFEYLAGNKLGRILDMYSVAAIFCVYTTMIAGGSSVLQEHYGFSQTLGSLLFAAAVLGVVLLGLKNLVNGLGSVGPVLVVLLITIALMSLASSDSDLVAGFAVFDGSEMLKASSHWLSSSVLYTSLQVIGLCGFLPPLGRTIKSQSVLITGGLLGPFLYFGALLLLILALFGRAPELTESMIPVLVLSEASYAWIDSIFGLVILVGIFSTAAPLLWILLARFSQSDDHRYSVVAVGVSGVAYLGGLMLPFDRILNLLYPTLSYVGVLIVILIFIKQWREGRII